MAWGNANTPGLHSQVWRGSWPGIAGDVGGIYGYGEEGVSGGYVKKLFSQLGKLRFTMEWIAPHESEVYRIMPKTHNCYFKPQFRIYY